MKIQWDGEKKMEGEIESRWKERLVERMLIGRGAAPTEYIDVTCSCLPNRIIFCYRSSTLFLLTAT